MAPIFPHGYALLIGVGASAYPKWSLPVTVKDMQALQAVLTDPALCGYPDDEIHIRSLHDHNATKQAILEGLGWLEERAAADSEATCLVFFSGHGWLDTNSGRYYLLPYDIEPFDLANSALAATTFTTALRRVRAKRLIAFIDSCHAAGMATSKDAPQEEPALKLPSGFEQTSLPKGMVDELKEGQGRAVFTSSRGEQRSWVRPDGSMSIYTYHLVEALHGAGSRPGESTVRLSDLMYYLGQAVPQSANAIGRQQTPFADLATEDFPVALLRGGKGLPGDPLAAVQKEALEKLQQLTIVQASEGSTTVSGDVSDSTLITGDGNVLGDGGISQVIKAEGGSTISGATQIAGGRRDRED